MPNLQIRPLSSLAKVFPHKIVGRVTRNTICFGGQELSLQVAYRVSNKSYSVRNYTVSVSTELCAEPSLFRVENVPSYLAAYPHRYDKKYITRHAGIFPDPLVPIDNGESVRATMGRWHSVWISLPIPKGHSAGNFKVKVSFTDKDGALAGETVFTVRVHSETLPDQSLLFTQWFHCDCIADAHGVEVFSEAHWALIEKYMALAAAHGINLLLTPVLTPPLHTAVGSERPTVQLVDVRLDDGKYSFDFSKLDRYVGLAKRLGIEHFEINHMFTQWGAEHAPKVMATVDGEYTRIFGWETEAASEEYKKFLTCLIPTLIEHMEQLGIDKDHMLFHVSDEPNAEKHLDYYRAATSILKPLIKGCRHMDALSDFDFYQLGLVDIPVVAIDSRITPFLEARLPNRWCYYCCGQAKDVSNRFFAMYSSRTRMMGVQLYKYDMQGFLQWGYNFYYSEQSIRKIDPWKETDGGEAFPSGDAFSVYPYGDGPIPSMRLKVFANALEDVRLLRLAEQKIGRETVLAEIDRIAGGTLTLTEYPTDERFFEELYKFIFKIL